MSLIQYSRKSTHSKIAQNAASVLILAENTNRKGVALVNTSDAVLYLLFDDATADISTEHDVQVAANANYNVPFNYTGPINGIWATAGAGSCNIAEFT